MKPNSDRRCSGEQADQQAEEPCPPDGALSGSPPNNNHGNNHGNNPGNKTPSHLQSCPGQPTVELSRGTARLPGEPEDSQLTAWLEVALASLNQSAAAVCLRIVGEQEMAQLNHRYRQRAEPTNVLAFPGTLALEGEPALLGDLAVCSQVIQAESERYRLPFSNRYAHILIHGLLHLLGYDHQQEDARLAMESKERALLAALGMTDPYETT